MTTIAFSGGAALATKIHWVRRAWALMEVAGAVGNIAGNTQTINPNSHLSKAVDAYNLGMAVISLLKNALLRKKRSEYLGAQNAKTKF